MIRYTADINAHKPLVDDHGYTCSQLKLVTGPLGNVTRCSRTAHSEAIDRAALLEQQGIRFNGEIWRVPAWDDLPDAPPEETHISRPGVLAMLAGLVGWIYWMMH